MFRSRKRHRAVLPPLWAGPLSSRREVQSRSLIVENEDDVMTDKRDYYEVLGVDKSASSGDLKNAFRRLARKYHPDRSTEENAEERFKEIQEAYAVLSDDNKRAQYDRFGHEGPQGSPFGGFGGGGFNINLDDIQVQKSDDHSDKIKLDDNIMMQMKYPSLDQFIKNNFDFNASDELEQSF